MGLMTEHSTSPVRRQHLKTARSNSLRDQKPELRRLQAQAMPTPACRKIACREMLS